MLGRMWIIRSDILSIPSLFFCGARVNKTAKFGFDFRPQSPLSRRLLKTEQHIWPPNYLLLLLLLLLLLHFYIFIHIFHRNSYDATIGYSCDLLTMAWWRWRCTVDWKTAAAAVVVVFIVIITVIIIIKIEVYVGLTSLSNYSDVR